MKHTGKGMPFTIVIPGYDSRGAIDAGLVMNEEASIEDIPIAYLDQIPTGSEVWLEKTLTGLPTGRFQIYPPKHRKKS